jgi:putative DNA primase/helicase
VIKEATGLISPNAEGIPEQLTARRQWVCWCLEEREGKPTKVLYTPGKGRRAKSNDLMTWRTFEEAFAAYEASAPVTYDGIGFVFCSADPFVGIDLDNCRDAESGEIAPWAQKVLSSVKEGYAEISPSGTGIHIIVEGALREGGVQKKVPPNGKIEMYSRDRFFTVTGEAL